MRKRLVAIYSVLVVAIVLLAVLVPSCGGEAAGTIEVKATFDGSPWSGAVNYTLTGPGSTITSTTVAKTFSVDVGSWTCAYVSGGPPGAYLLNITPSPTQSVSAGGTITFTLNFETPIGIQFAIKDAEVREAEPDRNLGGEPEMWVGPLVPPEDVLRHRAFVWFSLASLPAGATIQSATLYLYHSACAGGGDATHGAFRVTTVWEEGNITWNNQPPSAPGPTDEISFGVCDIGKWRSWDVTPDIDALATETGWVSWVIKIIPETSSERKRVVYRTKEGDPDPYLEITYLPTANCEYTPMVAAGVTHTVGLKSDGTVVAVGDNFSGQLDVGGWDLN